MLRIVFMGTPAFSVPTLEALVRAEMSPMLVVTQPQRARGRGRKISPTPVHACAERLGLETEIWDRGDRKRITSRVRDLRPDFLAVAAFGRILRPDLLESPREAPVNLHPSLLPKYRGTSPIQAALLAGDRVTGSTTMIMVDEVDAGDILLQEELVIDPLENAGELEERLAVQGADLVVRTLLEWSEVEPRPQGPAVGPITTKIEPSRGKIDWRMPAPRVHDHIRALNPKPGAFTFRRERRLLIRRARPVEGDTGNLAAGTLFPLPDGFPSVVCSPGLIRLEVVQAENRNPVPGDAYLRGSPALEEERLGEMSDADQ